MSSPPSLPKINSSQESHPPSPSNSDVDGDHETSPLILVHDDEEVINSPFNFSSDDDDDSFDDSLQDQPRTSPSVILLYLLSPYLKLGAILLPSVNLPLKFGIPLLVLFAVLSAFVRQIWYMLARYIRNADLEEVTLDSLVRSRGNERWRETLRRTLRAGTGLMRVLLAVTYLRVTSQELSPLLTEKLRVPFWIPHAVILILLLSLSFSAQSLHAKQIIYSTLLSTVSFLLWLGCVIFGHFKGVLDIQIKSPRMGALWAGPATIAFIFASSSTLDLYASLKGSVQPVRTSRGSKLRSFRALSALSVALAVALLLPLYLFSFPSASPDTSTLDMHPFIAIFGALTLLFFIPYIIVTTPSFIKPDRHSRLIMVLVVFAVSFVPTNVARVLNDILLVFALSSTYFLPALVHISNHYLKRPLAIIMPAHTDPHHNNNQSINNDTSPTSIPSHDELLQRKERALQKRQLRRRIVWDMGVWVLLVPLGAFGVVWAFGRVFGRW